MTILKLIGYLLWFAFGLLLVAAYALILLWAFSDAAARGKSGVLVVLLLVVTGPPGLLVWLLFRPDVQPRAVDRQSPQILAK